MQQKPQVSEQAVEEEMQVEVTEMPSRVLDVEASLADDPIYETALELLKHGQSPEQIAQKLVEKGVLDSSLEANRLALKVANENPQEQRTNAYVLFTVAGIVGGIGAIFIGLRWFAGDFSLSSVYLSLIVSAWFAYQGYRTYSGTMQEK